EASSSIFGLRDPGDIFYLTDLLDRLGIEAGTFGFTVAMAFEAYEKGLITKEDTDGLELRWGDPEVVEKIMRKWAYRDGFGDVLARGLTAAAEIIGGDSSNFTFSVKGTPIPLHDWRNQWARMLSFITGTGSGHNGRMAELGPDTDLGYPAPIPGVSAKGKPLMVAKANMRGGVVNSLGVCDFATSGITILDDIVEALSAATGWECSKEELLQIGERITNLERAFNVRHGLTPYDDYNVPARLVEEPPQGLPGHGKALKDYLQGMINEYYEIMGWDMKSGKPWISTLKRLGLEGVARDLWGSNS
ncbi:aldehyde ferredoxin oxidoreductase C-terminal domain-containing protein, partial [Chloroflexota bacterium]